MRLSDLAYKPLFTNRWFIWGMPLSGKSSFGKKLKKQVNVPVIDLDKAIEEQAGVEISVLFQERGEAYFRELEAKRLREISSLYEDFVLITGGGTPCYLSNAEFMLQRGNCLFLDTSLAILKERAQEQNSIRPKLAENPEQALSDLYTSRLPFYMQAHGVFYSEREGLDYFAALAL